MSAITLPMPGVVCPSVTGVTGVVLSWTLCPIEAGILEDGSSTTLPSGVSSDGTLVPLMSLVAGDGLVLATHSGRARRLGFRYACVTQPRRALMSLTRVGAARASKYLRARVEAKRIM